MNIMLGSRLKYAVTVGRLSSFSRAADAVGISQSSVTEAMKECCNFGASDRNGVPMTERPCHTQNPVPKGVRVRFLPSILTQHLTHVLDGAGIT